MHVWFERWFPLTIALISAASFFVWGERIFSHARLQEWDISSLYSSVFDIASIICAFLFSFLVFVKTTQNRVLNQFRLKPEYRTLMSHFRRSIISSFFLTIATIPYVVVVPVAENRLELDYYIVMIWMVFATYTLAATVRSSYQFISVLDAAYSSRFKKPPE